jgi:Domain of unknown function (DUF3303)
MPAAGPQAHARSRSPFPEKTRIRQGHPRRCPSIRKADPMTLFVTIHRHAPERCPAHDPAMGPALLSHLSPATAGQYGVSLQAEAVADGKHTLYLIAEAGDEEQLRRYLTPFTQAGSVEVLPASPCEAVINRGGCAQVPA